MIHRHAQRTLRFGFRGLAALHPAHGAHAAGFHLRMARLSRGRAKTARHQSDNDAKD